VAGRVSASVRVNTCNEKPRPSVRPSFSNTCYNTAEDLGVDGKDAVRMEWTLDIHGTEGPSLDGSALRQGQRACSCECGNGPSGSIKCEEFLERLRNCWPLKKDLAMKEPNWIMRGYKTAVCGRPCGLNTLQKRLTVKENIPSWKYSFLK
jgi:hypothetical protein